MPKPQHNFGPMAADDQRHKVALAHLPLLKAYSASVVKKRADNNDLLGHAYIFALRAVEVFDRSRGCLTIGTYLRKYLRHALCQARRSDRCGPVYHNAPIRHVRSTFQEEQRAYAKITDERTPQSLLSLTEEHCLLNNAIDDLPEQLKNVIRARYYEGLTIREIAEREDRCSMTISSYIRQGLDILRAQLNTAA